MKASADKPALIGKRSFKEITDCENYEMKVAFILILCCFSGFVYSQDVTAIIKKADALDASMNDAQALSSYKEALKLQPSNIYLLCKSSEISSRLGGRLKDNKTKQDEYYDAAKTYARTALQINPSYSDANFVMALVMGRDAMRNSGKDKIDAVRDIKKYVDLAIKYDPANYKAWFVLGKWYYEINALNYFERSAVKLFFGALPPADINDAIRCFEKTRSINPGFVLNYLSLAKAYKKKDEEASARKSLTVMLALPNKTQDDERIKSEGRDLLKKWD